MQKRLFLFLFSILLAGCQAAKSGQNAQQQPQDRPPVYGYTVVKSYPHDPEAFTQGLEFFEGILYEGTGRYGQSAIRKVDLETGKPSMVKGLLPKYFGEGITIFDGRLYEITWQQNTAFVYDLATFKSVDRFTYDTEGWGLTHDDKNLIMSDGTNKLYFLDPKTFKVARTVEVMDGRTAITELNELEYIKGEVWANVWQTDRIARIDPQTGKVTGWIDLSGLLQRDWNSTADVLNGIAYDAKADRIFVTGKLWPKLFEIKLVKK